MAWKGPRPNDPMPTAGQPLPSGSLISDDVALEQQSAARLNAEAFAYVNRNRCGEQQEVQAPLREDFQRGGGPTKARFAVGQSSAKPVLDTIGEEMDREGAIWDLGQEPS
jgi:hypothetical protein